jgi:hypothetical protein
LEALKTRLVSTHLLASGRLIFRKLLKSIHMKKLILFLPLLAFAGIIRAQSVSQEDIAAATTAAVELYQLEDSQLAEMQKIQARRLKNLADVESLRTSDYPLFLRKRSAIKAGTEASIKRLLNNEQMKILTQQQIEGRKRTSELIQRLKQEGATPEAIKTAVLELNLEE